MYLIKSPISVQRSAFDKVSSLIKFDKVSRYTINSLLLPIYRSYLRSDHLIGLCYTVLQYTYFVGLIKVLWMK